MAIILRLTASWMHIALITDVIPEAYFILIGLMNPGAAVFPFMAFQMDWKLSGRILKGPSLIYRDLHISELRCSFWYYDAITGTKLKKPMFFNFGA